MLSFASLASSIYFWLEPPLGLIVLLLVPPVMSTFASPSASSTVVEASNGPRVP